MKSRLFQPGIAPDVARITHIFAVRFLEPFVQFMLILIEPIAEKDIAPRKRRWGRFPAVIRTKASARLTMMSLFIFLYYTIEQRNITEMNSGCDFAQSFACPAEMHLALTDVARQESPAPHLESLPALRRRIAAREADRNAHHRTIAWQFTYPHAREKLSHLSPLAHTNLTEHS